MDMYLNNATPFVNFSGYGAHLIREEKLNDGFQDYQD